MPAEIESFELILGALKALLGKAKGNYKVAVGFIIVFVGIGVASYQSFCWPGICEKRTYYGYYGDTSVLYSGTGSAGQFPNMEIFTLYEWKLLGAHSLTGTSYWSEPEKGSTTMHERQGNYSGFRQIERIVLNYNSDNRGQSDETPGIGAILVSKFGNDYIGHTILYDNLSEHDGVAGVFEICPYVLSETKEDKQGAMITKWPNLANDCKILDMSPNSKPSIVTSAGVPKLPPHHGR